MKYIIGLSFLIFAGCSKIYFFERPSKAILPVIAAAGAAEVTIGSLEALQFAAMAAAASGVINASQNEQFQRSLGNTIQGIKYDVSSAIDSAEAVYKKISNSIQPPKQASSHKTAAVGDCPPSLRSDPRKCCQQFMDKYAGKKRNENSQWLFQIGHSAYEVHDPGGNLLCCLEWDSLHGRFEVYTLGGKGKYPAGESGDAYEHKGEESCQQNQKENLCGSDYPEKADLTGGHAPRDACRNMHNYGGDSSSPNAPIPGVQ